MAKNKNIPLKNGELIVEVIKPTQFHSFFRVAIGFVIIFLNAFFTFWLIQKGVEGQIFYGINYLLGFYLIFYGVLFKRSNYFVVTTERVFDVQRESVFSETLAAISFTDLVDVVVQKKGILSSLLNYGLVTLHPKDGKFIFEIERVPEPGRVQNLIFEKRDAALRNNQYLDNSLILKKVLKIVPELSEAELTMLYQRVHSQLLEIAKDVDLPKK